MPVDGFFILVALFTGALALAGILTLTSRLDKAERRRVYETECLVKSLQALEQQNHMLADRIAAVTEVRSSLNKVISQAAQQQATATEDEQVLPTPTAPRVLH